MNLSKFYSVIIQILEPNFPCSFKFINDLCVNDVKNFILFNKKKSKYPGRKWVGNLVIFRLFPINGKIGQDVVDSSCK